MRIICDEASHAPKVAYVGGIRTWMEDGVLHATVDSASADSGVRLTGDLPAARAEIAGTLAGPPTGPATLDNTRGRSVLECRLCGLRVETRQETVLRLATALRDADMREVRLKTIVAML